MSTSAFLLLMLLAASPASASSAAQQTAGSGWAAFLGCWQLVEERSTNENVTTRTCFAPGPSADAVVASTYLSDQTTHERPLTADGRPQPLELGPCRGTEQAEWSADRRRLFRRAELTCEGTPGTRRLSGVAFLVNGSTMVEIESTGPGVQVRRFFREGEPPPGVEAAAGAFTIADVREASQKLAPLVVEAAIVESHARFALDGQTLLALDKAGVDDHVIDLMVAVSYPRNFVVDRPGVPPGRVSSGGGGGGGFFGPGLGLYSGAEYAYGPWDPYGYWSYFGYRPYYINRNHYSFGIGGWSIEPGTDQGYGGGSGVDDAVASGTGVAVNGQGYTRVRTTNEVAVSRGSTNAAVSGEMPASRTRGSSGSSSGGDASSASSGSGGASSSGGYSSGGDGGADGGRTAVPR